MIKSEIRPDHSDLFTFVAVFFLNLFSSFGLFMAGIAETLRWKSQAK